MIVNLVKEMLRRADRQPLSFYRDLCTDIFCNLEIPSRRRQTLTFSEIVCAHFFAVFDVP